MICEKCKDNFPEKEIQESHDVPTYIFDGERRVRKQKADPYGRHNLCKKCHTIYERMVFAIMIREADYDTKQKMINSALKFSEGWFNERT